jgi:ATP-binding cassette subfamily C protein CydD
VAKAIRSTLNSPAVPAQANDNPSRWLAARLKGSRPALLINLVTNLLLVAMVISQAVLTAAIIADVFPGEASLTAEKQKLWLLLGILLLRAGLIFAGEVSAHAIASCIKSHLRLELFDHLFRLGPAITQNERTAGLTISALAGIESLEEWYSRFLPQLILAALLPTAILLFVFPRDLLSGLILLATAPLLPLFMSLIGRTSERLTAKRWAALGRLGGFFLDTLQGLTTIKLAGRSGDWYDRLADTNDRYRTATMNVLRVTFLSALALELLATLSTAVVAVEIGLRLLAGKLSYQPALMILLLAPEFYLPLRQLGLRFHASRNGLSAATRLLEILAIRPLPGCEGAVPSRVTTSIRFESVSVQYPGRGRPALQGVSFTINPGERVAITGESGAGKSTLFNLLLGFIPPSSGRILVDGTDMQSIPIDAWRNLIAWMPQKPFLFNASLGDNLKLGNPSADEDTLKDAGRRSGLADVLTSLPDGLDTPIGEGGLRLSGGQAQRLALARAFLKPAEFYLLDEAAAGLDPEASLVLADALKSIPAGKTVLAISHHPTRLLGFERVLHFKGGRLTHDLTAEEFMRRSGGGSCV